MDVSAAAGPEHEAPEHEAPVGDLERDVAAIWQEVLGTRHVGRDDNFFALGGHSFTAMRVITLLGERLKIEISLRSIFEAPTVRELAAYINTLPSAPDRSSTDAAAWEEGVL